MMTGQIFFSPDKPRFWPVKLMNNYYNYFFAHGISNYTGSRSLYGIVVQVFAGKLVKNSFTRCWVPFLNFRPFYVRLYIPSVSSYGGVRSLQGSSYICISVKLDPFRYPARDQKSPPQRRISLLYICSTEVDLARNLFHKQRLRHQKSINIQQSFRLGRRANGLSRRRILSSEIGDVHSRLA